MNEYVPINCLKVGQKYNQIFLIKSVAERSSKKNGNNYLLVTLQDVTGNIIGPIWDCSLKEIIIPGKWVSMEVVIEEFNGRKNFTASLIVPFNGEPSNVLDYIHGPNENVLDVYSTELTTILSDIEDAHFRDIINNTENRMNLTNILKTSAYDVRVHFSHRGGLLLHTRLLLQTSLEAERIFRHDGIYQLDKSLLIAGCLFRNIGYWSILEMDGASFFKQKASFNAFGIRAASFMICNHCIISTESDLHIEIPEDKKLKLQNICLANNKDQCVSIEAEIIISNNQLIDAIYARPRKS